MAIRLKNEGLTVYGFGEEKTPDAFRNACHKFIFKEVLRPKTDDQATQLKNCSEKNIKKELFKKKFILEDFLKEAIAEATNDADWVELGTFGQFINRLKPDFDSRHYGYKKLSELVKGYEKIFNFEWRSINNTEQKALYLKVKS